MAQAEFQSGGGRGAPGSGAEKPQADPAGGPGGHPGPGGKHPGSGGPQPPAGAGGTGPQAGGQEPQRTGAAGEIPSAPTEKAREKAGPVKTAPLLRFKKSFENPEKTPCYFPENKLQ